MPITVEFAPKKEEILKKGDEECKELAEKLREAGKVYIDSDFPPNVTSIGVLKNYDTGEFQVPKSDEPWLQPKEFIKPHYLREDCVDEWKVWDNPQPFHVKQGDLGDCGLIAALMAVAQKKGLIEQIIPKRGYTMDCGIVQVRLLVNGEWKVIKTDFHIPQVDGWEIFSKMTKRQCWVAFIEKAFAKVKGSYGQLDSLCPTEAFKCLTGHPSKRNCINSKTNSDALWEDLIKHNSSGSFLAAATPRIEEGSEEKKKYEEVDLDTNHAYAILGFKEHKGHRLLRLGHGNWNRFKGKWSHLHAYDNEFLKDLCSLDREISNERIFWMEIEDFRRLFLCYFVCGHREWFTAVRFKEIVRRKKGDDMQCKIRSGKEDELCECLSFCTNYWHPVPPKSRSIVGVVASDEDEPITVSVDVQYSINYLYFKWINRLAAWIVRDEILNFTPLESEN
ncbi:hypothetical protein CAEBREN_16962 [Caenorhabditis brenneri]|uniref:Calpain catalytic domain-containing protein n=1 Tax=Caenorhabditis brenneri TaxID=135651 RepID=G0NNN4_CAEBE|nr:hypothetical protein CAEBREN_16962 [Caenorhabditis brenneri]